jgi:hypothetical protein
MSEIRFNIRWREELQAISTEGILLFEITMGELHVYFPTEKRWELSAPDWAKEKWKIYVDACSNWCAQNKIPISMVDDAYISEEKA